MSSRPPWRPRLVEEGTPLYADGNTDRSMQEAADDHYRRSPQHHTHSLPSYHPSSLAAAASRGDFHTHQQISKKLVVGGDEHHHGGDLYTDSDEMSCSSSLTSPAATFSQTAPSRHRTSPLRTRLVIGEDVPAEPHPHDYEQQHHDRHHGAVERMEGVEHHGERGPLVVMDGANLAYAYADAMGGFSQRREPDARGIQVAANYFLQVGVRVLVVIPAPWFRSKPRIGDETQGNALMMTPQLEVLKDLKERRLLVASPPQDDDDAYALTIARREDARSHAQGGGGGGFVLSCDLFRDAVNRDMSGNLREWLSKDKVDGSGQGRISFAFCDMGATDTYGDREMDFVPNPRHPLISWIENEHRKRAAKDL